MRYFEGIMSSYILQNRAYLRLSGPDAARYLGGQITQKVDDLLPGHVRWTAVTNAKGGIEGVGCVQVLDNGSFLFDCPSEIGDEMETRLDRYLIADDCEWSREDDRWVTVIQPAEQTPKSSTRYRNNYTESLYDQTHPDDLPPLPEELENQWCAQYAVPRWEREITAGKLPAEVGLHSLALSFDKGCYIGQEIISRMEAAGKTRTKLYQVVSDTELSENYSTTAKIHEKYYGLAISKNPPEEKEVKAF